MNGKEHTKWIPYIYNRINTIQTSNGPTSTAKSRSCSTKKTPVPNKSTAGSQSLIPATPTNIIDV